MRKKTVAGYFTVEATLLMGIILGSIFLVMYLWFLAYDRALMDLDAGTIAVKSAMEQGLSPDERASLAAEMLREAYRAPYAAWKFTCMQARMVHGKVEIRMEGRTTFPFPFLNFWSADNVWEGGSTRIARVQRPAFLIRTWRKMSGMLREVTSHAGN